VAARGGECIGQTAGRAANCGNRMLSERRAHGDFRLRNSLLLPSPNRRVTCERCQPSRSAPLGKKRSPAPAGTQVVAQAPRPDPLPASGARGIARLCRRNSDLVPALVCLQRILHPQNCRNRMLSMRHARVDFRSCCQVVRAHRRGRRRSAVPLPLLLPC